MKTMTVKELIPNSFFSSPVYLPDEKYILLSSDTPVTDSLLKRLSEWKFSTVVTDGEAVKARNQADPSQGETTESKSAVIRENDPHEKEKLEAARALYENAVKSVESYFADYLKTGELQIEPISELIKGMVNVIKDDRSSLPRMMGLDASGKNYLVIHSVKTAILALTSGFYLKLPIHKLLELGIAALVHEIGMIRLPPHLYMAPRGLTPQEKRAVMTHPILGFNVLKGSSFPMTVASAVLEHHERMDGSGYPRAISGEKLSPYARILAVCCSYDALISKRPYREAKDGHEGILNLLRDRGVQYDEQSLRALVFSLSVFPLGSYVLLSTGVKGIVVEANPLNPRLPLIKVVADNQGYLLKDHQHLQTSEPDCTIIRSLTPDEVNALQE